MNFLFADDVLQETLHAFFSLLSDMKVVTAVWLLGCLMIAQSMWVYHDGAPRYVPAQIHIKKSCNK